MQNLTKLPMLNINSLFYANTDNRQYVEIQWMNDECNISSHHNDELHQQTLSEQQLSGGERGVGKSKAGFVPIPYNKVISEQRFKM